MKWNRRVTARQRTRRWRRAAQVGLLSMTMILALGGCEGELDKLLAVDRPGQLPVAALDDPELVPSLYAGTQSTFECAFRVYISFFGKWSGVIANSGARNFQAERRNFETTLYDYVCTSSYTNSGFNSLHTARGQAKLTIDIASKYTDAEIPNRGAIIAKSRLYQAYSILLLSEGFCAVTIDGGPPMGRGAGFQLAADMFTDALSLAAGAGADQALVTNAARIGRARARLNLGDGLGVVSDVDQVTPGFVFYSEHEAQPGTRQNLIYEEVSHPESNGASISEFYWPLRELGGVPDPRIPLIVTAQIATGTLIPIRSTTRYSSSEDDMPIATWREAQLMKAEVLLGTEAVTIINDLRSTVDEAPYVPAGTYNLPTFSGSTPAEILQGVKEERIRETFLMGTHMGDLMRWNTSDPAPFGFPTGVSERGGQYVDANTCRPLPDYEVLGNSNITADPPWPTTPMP